MNEYTKNSNPYNVSLDDYFSRHKLEVMIGVIKRLSKDKKILDVGCGDGTLTAEYSQFGHQVVGIDQSKIAIGRGQRRYRDNKKIKFFAAQIEEFKTREKFDLVIASSVFEHVENPSEFLRSVDSLLGENGSFLMITPNIDSIKNCFTRMLFGEVEYRNKYHVCEYNRDQVKKFLQQHNFILEKIFFQFQFKAVTNPLLLFSNIINFLIKTFSLNSLASTNIYLSRKGTGSLLEDNTIVRKVDFFLVGAPRSATTTIAENLSRLKSIFIPTEKEPHFFCFDFHREGYKFHKRRTFFRHLSWKSYDRVYQKSHPGQILGDCSTSYIYSKEAAKQIYDYNSEAKIIAVIREPVSLMYSWYKYLKYYNEETALNFSEAINLEEKRKKGGKTPSLVKFPTRLQYSRIADYNTNLDRYKKIFAQKNILIILYDDFIKKPEEVLNKILSFVGSPERLSKAITNRNAQKDFRFRSVKKIADFLVIKFPVRRLPKFIKRPISGMYHSIFDVAGDRKKLDTKTIKLLKGKYHKEVYKLSKMINRDLLKIWHY